MAPWGAAARAGGGGGGGDLQCMNYGQGVMLRPRTTFVFCVCLVGARSAPERHGRHLGDANIFVAVSIISCGVQRAAAAGRAVVAYSA
eukprot:gene22848-biopygen5782